jgi:hypothetical protein
LYALRYIKYSNSADFLLIDQRINYAHVPWSRALAILFIALDVPFTTIDKLTIRVTSSVVKIIIYIMRKLNFPSEHHKKMKTETEKRYRETDKDRTTTFPVT